MAKLVRFHADAVRVVDNAMTFSPLFLFFRFYSVFPIFVCLLFSHGASRYVAEVCSPELGLSSRTGFAGWACFYISRPTPPMYARDIQNHLVNSGLGPEEMSVLSPIFGTPLSKESWQLDHTPSGLRRDSTWEYLVPPGRTIPR